MKLTVFLLLTCLMAISAESYSQSQRLNLKMGKARIVDIFSAIEEQSEYYFFYKNDEISGINRVDAAFENATIDKIMSSLLENSGLSY
ncbi:MAG: STN domain-containing protein [Mangrovibacterium sp.]